MSDSRVHTSYFLLGASSCASPLLDLVAPSIGSGMREMSRGREWEAVKCGTPAFPFKAHVCMADSRPCPGAVTQSCELSAVHTLTPVILDL